MNTAPMQQQRAALRYAQGRDAIALGMEQGTGKTWVLLAEAERRYATGEIEGVVVIAPSGVHTNWIRKEIPEHLSSPSFPVIAEEWRSGAGVRYMERLDSNLFRPRKIGERPPLRIFAINIEAISTKAGYAFAIKFMRAVRCMLIVDESQKIKNERTSAYKQCAKLRPHAACAAIASGTMVENAPLDLFAQFAFLDPDRPTFGTTSYRAFAAEYADVLPLDSRMMKALIERNPRMRHAQLIARNADGSHKYRNLDKLRRLLAKVCFRVTKAECLDLPDKVYTRRYFQLTPKLRALYRSLDEDRRIVEESGEVKTFERLAVLMKLQQVTSGFLIPTGDEEPQGLLPMEENPRLIALAQELEEADGSVIVYARFKEELRMARCVCEKLGLSFVEYHGSIRKEQREEAKIAFQSGEARVFLAQVQAASVGLTLTAASTVIYLSNTWGYGDRAQSEDRAHRIGQKRVVRYIDILATETIDESIVRILRSKLDVSIYTLGSSVWRNEVEV
jgi:SNF2 family DNA or RNA helicase